MRVLVGCEAARRRSELVGEGGLELSPRLAALVIVSDNGPAYKSDRFARFIAAHPWLAHIRRRYRSPQTNGVIERFYGALKYERLYRVEIANGIELNDEAEAYRRLYNEIRPHESLDLYPPMPKYLATPITFDDERAHNAAAREAFEDERRGRGGSSAP